MPERKERADLPEDGVFTRQYEDGTVVRQVSVKAVSRSKSTDNQTAGGDELIPAEKFKIFRVVTPKGNSFDIYDRRRAFLLAELVNRYTNLRLRYDMSTVPLRVALDGKAAIAAYLTVISPQLNSIYAKYTVSNYMGLSIDTVSQYLTDFIAGRR